MAWIEIMPGFETPFRERGWNAAAPFLEWGGVLVNQHRHRQVEQVVWEQDLANASGSEVRFFLKKETRVRWRERLRNAWHGFGWCANSVREAVLLRAARAAGIGCPEVAAFGEDGANAFVLLRDEADMVELRAFLPTLTSDEERHRLAEALGRELARMHDAGFAHPDLFAKHILAARFGATFQFCILDWARARRRRRVSWRSRCRDLAILDATLHASLASDLLRARFLIAYLRAWNDAPPTVQIAARIRQQANRRRGERHLREIGQRATPARDHQFVPLCAGRLLVVRSYFDQCGGVLPDWLTKLPDAETQAEDFCLTIACASSTEKMCLQTWPTDAARWEIPPLAHLLFRLQRFGVRAPRLRAVGASTARAFLLTEALATIPFDQAFAKAGAAQRRRLLARAGRLIRQVHEAGYILPAGDDWARRLGVIPEDNGLVLAQVEPLERGHVDTQAQRFLRGYLENSSPASAFTERQTAA